MNAEPMTSRLYPQTIVEHERSLPGEAQVLVSAGAWVQANDVVVRGQEPPSVRVIDAAQALAIACDDLPDCLLVTTGQEVHAGQALAATGFMGWRIVRAPVAGRVAEIAAGRIFIEEPPRPIELRTYLPGQVTRVLPNRGAVIRAAVSRIVGIWGVGGECYGPLLLRTQAPTQTLQWTSVDGGCRGKIVVGGLCLDTRVLLRAARVGALGLIVGSLAEHLRARAEELGLVVMVTDALGAVPMAAPVFDLLAHNEGREGLLASGRTSPTPVLPALNIPLADLEGPVDAPAERPLAVGDRVRLTRAPHLGAMGCVQALVEQDGRTWVKVRLDQGRATLVPYRNLERLG